MYLSYNMANILFYARVAIPTKVKAHNLALSVDTVSIVSLALNLEHLYKPEVTRLIIYFAMAKLFQEGEFVSATHKPIPKRSLDERFNLIILWCRRIFIIQHASVVVLRRGKARTCKIPPIITILYPVYLNGEIDLAKLGLSKMGTARLFSKCDRYWVLCPGVVCDCYVFCSFAEWE